jgi:hypothetical protein
MCSASCCTLLFSSHLRFMFPEQTSSEERCGDADDREEV